MNIAQLNVIKKYKSIHSYKNIQNYNVFHKINNTINKLFN